MKFITPVLDALNPGKRNIWISWYFYINLIGMIFMVVVVALIPSHILNKALADMEPALIGAMIISFIYTTIILILLWRNKRLVLEVFILFMSMNFITVYAITDKLEIFNAVVNILAALLLWWKRDTMINELK